MSAIDGLHGNRIKSQEWARWLLPMLVNYAGRGVPVSYGDLAEEMFARHEPSHSASKPDALSLRHALEIICCAIDELNGLRKTTERIPIITALVCNKGSLAPRKSNKPLKAYIPSKIIESLNHLPKKEKEKRIGEIAGKAQKDTFSYDKWDEVLDTLRLKRDAQREFWEEIDRNLRGGYGGGGEGPEHERLACYVLEHPEEVNFHDHVEYKKGREGLPSGDIPDAYFRSKERILAVEVKSHISRSGDLKRGVYQCIKYRSVIRAMMKADGKKEPEKNADCILVVGQVMPDNLKELAKKLSVRYLVILPEEMV